MILTDRSRIERFQQCPRARYWEYEHRGGIVPQGAPNKALLIGLAFHAIVAKLLEDGDIIDALGGELSKLQSDDPRSDETVALVEAMARSWALVRLPQLLHAYEVLSVEREEEPFNIGMGIHLMVRTDAVLRRKADEAVFVWNAKTARRCDELWRMQWLYDPQTLSEVLPVEQRLNEPISGVLIEGIEKGDEREYPQGSGERYTDNPLIWAWTRDGAWSARYQWTDESGVHRLGRGWTKQAVWKVYPGGVKAWVEHLAASQAQVLEERFYVLPPILRSAWEIERWKRQTAQSELRIAADRGEMSNFPMHTGHGNCIRPFRCPYIPLCWQNTSPESELFTPRLPNHEPERRKFLESSLVGETSDGVEEINALPD